LRMVNTNSTLLLKKWWRRGELNSCPLYLP